MKRFMFFVVMAGCAPSTHQVGIIPGENGANGHSIVSNSRSASEFECLNGGNALDVYLDLDDNLAYSDSDVWQNSLVACNGARGEIGQRGLDGIDGSSCGVTQGLSGMIMSCTNGTSASVSNGSSCSVAEVSGGAKISCADGTEVFLPNGQSGQNGSSCSVENVSGGASIQCTDGTFAFISNGQNGRDGQDGQNGQNGQNGKDGEVCMTVEKPNGATIVCPNGSSANIYNGQSASINTYRTPSGTANLSGICVPVANTSLYANKSGQSVNFYSNSGCTGSASFSLDSGNNNIKWLSPLQYVLVGGGNGALVIHTVDLN